MLQLRSAVYAADQAGSDVEGSLQALQAYVTAHMNTNLSAGPDPVYPPIQLKYTYERLVKAQSDQLSAANSRIYNDAQKYCEKQDSIGFSGRNRVPCIEKYVKSHGGKQLPEIPDALYKFDFVSPSWSPDLAGWSLVVVVISAVLFIASLITRLWFKRQLH